MRERPVPVTRPFAKEDHRTPLCVIVTPLTRCSRKRQFPHGPRAGFASVGPSLCDLCPRSGLLEMPSSRRLRPVRHIVAMPHIVITEWYVAGVMHRSLGSVHIALRSG